MTFTLTAGEVLSANPDPQVGEVMIGKALARSMGADVGSMLTLLSTTSDGALNAIDVRVRGIFSVGVEEADKRLVYTHLSTAQELLRTAKVSTLSIYLSDIDETTPVLNDLAARYTQFASKPWWDLAPYYVAVKALFNRLFGVLGIVLVVLVFFSVSNTMTMSVVERTRETGTLAALGAYPRELIRNFVLEATVIGSLGALIGMALAGSISFLIAVADVQMPPPPGRSEGYPLEIDVSLPLYLLTGVLVLFTCMAAAFLAARRGVKKPIVEALAYV